METQNEVNKIKYLIFEDLRQALELILCSSAGGAVLGNDSCLAQSFTHTLDRILRHGLRDLHKGYWPIVQVVTHSATIQLINSLKSVHSLLGKGRAWLYLSLTEGSLESYLQCLLRDKQTLRKHYFPHSLMRDEPALGHLVEKVRELQNVQFFLDPDVSYLDMSSYKQQTSMDSQALVSMTTSLTSSLASPVDSGVALLDSDLDATSVSEATCSLRDDDSSVMDMDDNLYDVANTQINTIETSGEENVLQEMSIGKPILCEAILLRSNNTTSITTRVRNSKELENALLNDAAAHLAQNALVHYPGYCEEQVLEKCDIAEETLSTLEVEDSNSTIIGSDVVNEALQFKGLPLTYTTSTVPEVTNIPLNKEIKTECGTDCDEIVFRRQRKKNKSKAEVKVKRVSFHEDVILSTGDDVTQELNSDTIKCTSEDGSSQPEFSASFLPPNAIIKKDVVKGRYSWCAEGDAPYMQQPVNNSKTKSDVYLTSDHGTATQSENSSNQYLTSRNNTHILKNNNTETAETNELKLKTRTVNRRLQGLPSYNYSALETNLKSFPIHEERYSQSPKFVDSKCQMLQMEALLQLSSNEDRVSNSSIIAERGMPEGQEDPQKMCPQLNRHASIAGLSKFSSVASNLDCFSDSESAADFNVRRNLTKRNSIHGSSNKLSRPAVDSKYGRMSTFEMKATLLNRFLKLVTVKKFVEKRAETKVHSRSLYIKGVKYDPELNREFEISLNEEIYKCCNRIKMDGFNVEITPELEIHLKGFVFASKEENVLKVFEIRGCYLFGGLSMPLLLILTDIALYITGVKDNYTYCNHFVLPYKNLDTVLVGPCGHAVELGTSDRQARFMFATGDRRLTQSIVGSIERIMRLKGCRLPGVRCLNFEDMVTMRKSLVLQAGIFEEDPLFHYSLVFLQENQSASPCTPLGPTKEGHLMFRIATKGSIEPWIPGYFILKAGAVYMFEDQGHRLPKQVLMLRNGQCKGCQRLLHDRRPHTFQIILGCARAIQFAASDEYEASDWLQAFIQAAAGPYQEESIATTACTLALTARRIVTCIERFPSGQAQILSSANIGDLTSYHACDRWCVLEFACQEVNESSGDWILYFASAFERQAFQDNLQLLWQKLHQQTEFPVRHVVEDYLATRCLETGQLLHQAWYHLLTGVALQ